MGAKVNHRVTVHRGRVFRLVRENVTLENGVTVDIEFIRHPGAAAVAALTDQSRLILLRQYRHALGRSIWEIPAGTLEPHESPQQCAARELAEESGFEAARWHKLGEITPVPGYSDERIHIFAATDLRPVQRHLDADELISVREVRLQEALDMIARGEIRDAKSICGIYWLRQWRET